MPLLRRDPIDTSAKGGASKEKTATHIAALASADADARWAAARALGSVSEAVDALAEALRSEQVPRVREAMMTALMRTGGDAGVAALLPYLRSQDAGIRSSAIEALQALPESIRPFMARLLKDPDTDVRILVCELARGLSAEDATHILCTLLEHERHPNVCASAIEVLAEVGTSEAVPVLQACAKRFGETPFLPFAVSAAVARITGTAA